MTVDWADLYRATCSDLVRYLFRKVQDMESAKDLAHEAFLRVLAQSPDHPRAWLFTVATNLARDHARKEAGRRKHRVLIGSHVDLGTEEENLAEQLEREARRIAAQRALSSLRERDRELLLLWNAGLSYTEIAARTGLAPGAVGTSLARARRRLVTAHQSLEGTG